MEIRISRRGGFAGIDEELASVRTEDLDAAEASRLETQVDDINFFSLPSELPSDLVGADQFTYSVTITDRRGSHTVSYQDDWSRSQTAAPLADIVDVVLRGRSDG